MTSGTRFPRGLLAFLAAVYVFAFPYHPQLRSPNELCRLMQTRALVEYGTLSINRALRDYGRVGDLSVYQGRYYPSKAPLLAFAAVPLYEVMRAVGGGYRYAVKDVPFVYFARLFLTVLPTLLMLFLLRRFLAEYVGDPVADAVVATYALGTLAFSYSLLFMSHQTTAVLLFCAFYVLWRLARGEWRERGYLLAGFLAASAVAAEYTGGLGVLGLVVYVLSVFHVAEGDKKERLVKLGRAAGLATLGALPVVIALGLYHWACFGSPLETGYKHLADAAYQPWHLGGFLGIRTPDPRAFVLSFFSPLRGLFTLSPFLLLSLPGLYLQAKRARADRSEWPLFVLPLALWLGYAYFTSSFAYDSWGWTTGPRHLTGLVPFELLPVALVFESLRARGDARSRALRAISAGLCGASIVVTGALTCINYVPDDVQNGFFGFAVPLLSDGYTPPTVLSFLGVPTPWAGLVLVLALAAGAAWVVFRLAGALGRELPWGFAALSVTFLFLALLSLARPDAHDAAAVRFLERSWIAPPGASVQF